MVQRYIVIGAGGTGTHLIDPLLRYLRTFHKGTDPAEWQFGIMDGDNVEPKNLDRQLFAPQDIQMNKARAAAQVHDYLGNVVAIPEYLSAENIVRYLTDDITIFIAVDNFPVRSLIESYCQTLKNSVVINGGNEMSTGSCQIWVRADGENKTPPLSFLHDEIHDNKAADRAGMTCAQVAALPGGEQLIAVNAFSATMMLTALIKHHRGQLDWTETQFDILKGEMFGMDLRERRGWQPEQPEIAVIN